MNFPSAPCFQECPQSKFPFKAVIGILAVMVLALGIWFFFPQIKAIIRAIRWYLTLVFRPHTQNPCPAVMENGQIELKVMENGPNQLAVIEIV